MNKIEGFKKEPYKFLSNMALFPKPVSIDGIEYGSSENYYQAMKTTDKELRKKIAACNPHESKKVARDIELRPDWDEIKLKVMCKILRYKFKKFGAFRAALLGTGDAYIEETNWWNDTYWGVCRGVGENHLGKIIMMIRDEILDGDGSVHSGGYE